MSKFLALIFSLLLTQTALAATFTVTPSSALQTVINASSSGDTIQFNAGTYNIPGTLTLKCGVTYTATTPATPSNVILNGTAVRHSNWIFNINGGCTSGATTISYLSSLHAGFLSVSTPNSNLTVTHNQVGDLPCCNGADAGMTFGDPAGSNFNFLANGAITWNTIGDSISCRSGPQTLYSANNNTGPNDGTLFNAFAWTGPDNNSPLAPNGDEGPDGGCVGINIGTSTNGLIIENNIIKQAEGVHIVCYGGNGDSQLCSPSGQNGTSTGSGPLTYGLVAKYNDFVGNHRIPWEEQAQVVQGLDIEFNSTHGIILPYPGTFLWSMACCANPASTTPYTIFQSNVILMDTVPTPAYGVYGYGIEAWGFHITYGNNLIQSSNYTVASNGQGPGPGIAWGYGIQSGGSNFQYNTVCGQPFTTGGYIVSEGFAGVPAPTLTGNVTSTNCNSYPSIAPTFSPTPTGTYSSPIAVTINDSGYTSGAQPLGNTNVYYTTDGSTPTFSSTFCLTPCHITVSPGTTVNAFGMWGQQNQPTSYTNGYGFTPSAVVGAHYSAGSTPTLSGVSLSLTGGGSTLQTGNTVQACATATYPGVSPIVTCGNGPDTYGTTFGTWTSSIPGSASISSSGLVQGIAAGSTNLAVKATQGSTNFTASPFALTVANPTPVLTGVTISDGGVSTLGSTQTVQATATAQYTQSITQNCTSTPDQYGTTCGTWLSSTPAAATVNSSGLISGVAAGSTNITVKATPTIGSAITSATPLALTVTGTPPVATLTGVTASCASSSVQAGNTDACAATCAYTVGPPTNCTTADSHGTTASGWASGTPATATINSTTGVATAVAAGTTSITVHAGSFTSPGYTLTVTAVPPVTLFLGDPNYDTPGNTSPNYINSTYAVTGTNPGGYTAAACTFTLPPGTYTAGSLWDCGLIPAPTPTTQASSWLCHNTYTNTGTSTDVGAHVVPLSGLCGVLPVSTAYWVGVITNHPGRPGQGFSTCSGLSCAGSAPTVGQGTYPYRYISATYGVYTGMGTAMNATGTPGLQSSQYVTLSNPLPTLTGAFLADPGPTTILSVNGAVQFYAFCQYMFPDSSTSYDQCSPGTDQYGNTVTAWSSSQPSVVSIGNIGSAHPGLAMGVAPSSSTVNIQATITGGRLSSVWGLAVSTTPLPYPPTTARQVSR